MKENEFNQELKKLINLIAQSFGVQKKQESLINETKPKTHTEQVHKYLADLRICLKYLLLDLEATRRERDTLKAMFGQTDNDEPDKIDGEI